MEESEQKWMSIAEAKLYQELEGQQEIEALENIGYLSKYGWIEYEKWIKEKQRLSQKPKDYTYKWYGKEYTEQEFKKLLTNGND